MNESKRRIQKRSNRIALMFLIGGVLEENK